jgi:hypothetical protein
VDNTRKSDLNAYARKYRNIFLKLTALARWIGSPEKVRVAVLNALK